MELQADVDVVLLYVIMLFGALLIGLAFRLRGAPGRAVGTMAHAA
jgi:hypothetical protein